MELFTGYRTLASGNVAHFLDGVFQGIEDDGPDYEGPTCSICDGLGHGYPGGGPCPLEETGEQGVPWQFQ